MTILTQDATIKNKPDLVRRFVKASVALLGGGEEESRGRGRRRAEGQARPQPRSRRSTSSWSTSSCSTRRTRRAASAGAPAGLGADASRCCKQYRDLETKEPLDRVPHQRVPAAVNWRARGPRRASSGAHAPRAAARAPIEVEGVSQVFRRGGHVTHALDRIDLTIAAGEFVAIVGPSGCGKSTLLRIVAGLLRAHRRQRADRRPRGRRAADRSRHRVPEPGAARLAQRARQRARAARAARARSDGLPWRARTSSSPRSASASSTTACRASCPAACASAPPSCAR